MLILQTRAATRSLGIRFCCRANIHALYELCAPVVYDCNSADRKTQHVPCRKCVCCCDPCMFTGSGQVSLYRLYMPGAIQPTPGAEGNWMK